MSAPATAPVPAVDVKLAAAMDIDPDSPGFVAPPNYVTRTVENMKWLPPVTASNLLSNIQWISFGALTIPPAMAIWAFFNIPIIPKTVIWS
jgi:stearoyl-CoA desaturase (delta-9 desaturase)